MNELKIDNDTFIIVGSQEWKDEVLSTDPFEGDVSDGTLLEDKIVKVSCTKKLCSGCLSICKPNTYSRVIVDKVDGGFIKNRFCETCCNSFAWGDVLYTEDMIFIDDEDIEEHCTFNKKTNDWDEPKQLWQVQEELRSENEKYLVKEVGARWITAPKIKLYEVMSMKETKYLLKSKKNAKRLKKSIKSITDKSNG